MAACPDFASPDNDEPCTPTDYTCTSCHGSDDNPAPPFDLAGNDATDATTVGAHRTHVADGELRRAVGCTACHIVPETLDASGHVGAPPAELTWNALAAARGTQPTWDRASGRCENYCHGATLSGGTNTRPQWTVVDGSQAACGTCHGAPPPPPHPPVSACGACHPVASPGYAVNLDTHIDGILQVNGSSECGSCHDVPPATGTHLLHFSATTADATYGDTSITADLLPDGGGYAFNCGNCHPLDPSHHGNGVVNSGGGAAEVDLGAAGAPPGSLKARNGANAQYTPGSTVLTDADGLDYTLGTCSEVYCHSSRTVETPADVPEPGVEFPFVDYPITYPAYTVTYGREYRNPTWGSLYSCDDCHGFPPRTEDPLVSAGAGDSHSFIDSDGYEDLHGWAHGADPIPCSACHYSVVTDPGVRLRDYTPPATGWSIYYAIPISDYRFHVNGQADVAFSPDPVDLIRNPFALDSATWDPAGRSCQDVSCHLLDNPVVWGTPYRYGNTYECNVCHHM